jgi:hypothetical protein
LPGDDEREALVSSRVRFTTFHPLSPHCFDRRPRRPAGHGSNGIFIALRSRAIALVMVSCLLNGEK